MTGSERPQNSILDFPKRFMVITGIWRASSITLNSSAQKAYIAYCVFVKLYYSLFVALAVIKFTMSVLSENSTEFRQLSYIISMLTTLYAAMVCDTINFRRIISYIEDRENYLAGCDDEDLLKLYSLLTKTGKFVSTTLVLTVASTGSAVILENIWRNVAIAKHNSGGNGTAEIAFIIDLYYFGLTTRKPATAFILVNECMSVFNIIMTFATKSITLTCMIFASYALQELQIRLRKIGMDADVDFGFKRAVSQHLDVISYIHDLNDLVKYLILFEYLFESLNVAVLSVQLAAYESQTLLSSASYLSYLLLQIFMLGWTADEIKMQSVALSDALYQCPWYEQNEASKKVILVMIKLTQKPLTLTIGPFDAMTMQSALAIIKGSYSYVTLMTNSYQ
ncbi:odorant receptor 2a-like [Cylas formicarius]|uniref:odorant receptor 2a-like n=1 Tax=Cylas formicarius TaxID=197179 RepID=UPI002958D1B2|nr:odorant receptor 2a-like [Cylas formicarius]